MDDLDIKFLKTGQFLKPRRQLRLDAGPPQS